MTCKQRSYIYIYFGTNRFPIYDFLWAVNSLFCSRTHRLPQYITLQTDDDTVNRRRRRRQTDATASVPIARPYGRNSGRPAPSDGRTRSRHLKVYDQSALVIYRETTYLFRLFAVLAYRWGPWSHLNTCSLQPVILPFFSNVLQPAASCLSAEKNDYSVNWFLTLTTLAYTWTTTDPKLGSFEWGP